MTKHRVVLLVAAAFLVLTGGALGGRPAAAFHSKSQAEVNVLRVVSKNWNAARMPGIIDPKTKSLADNTQIRCVGHGRPKGGNLYHRFTCVIRPMHHTGHQGLYITYVARADGHFVAHWLDYLRK